MSNIVGDTKGLKASEKAALERLASRRNSPQLVLEPELAKRDGKALDGFDPKTGFFPGSVGGLMKSPFKFGGTEASTNVEAVKAKSTYNPIVYDSYPFSNDVLPK